MSDLSNRARSLANLQEQMDAISPRETHKPMIDCLRACADALDPRTASTPAPGADHVVGLEDEPHVWTWQSCENSQGWNTKYGNTPPEPGPWISEIQPLFAARPTETRVVTVTQLDRFTKAVDSILGSQVVDNELRDNVVAEIRAIIGCQANE